jgi:Fe-S cluster biosynthesis and repair protein YggX
MVSINTVYCRKLKRELPAFETAPIAGPIGEVIVQHVSKEAFNEWLEVQMKIINEERLDLSEEASQGRLYQQMIHYLELDDLVE